MEMKRKKPMNLVLLENLKCRNALPPEHNWYLADLERGFKYECLVDDIIESIGASWKMIRGFSYYPLFEEKFQLDLLLTTRTEIIVNEIKGYRTDIYFDENGVIRNSNDTIIDDPLDQVEKATKKLQKLLNRLNIDLKISYNVIIATEGATIYGLPKDKPIILHHQIKEHFTKLASKIAPPTESVVRQVNKLLKYNNDKSHRWPDMPIYSFNGMEKGLYFNCCGKSVPPFEKYSKKVTCHDCGMDYTILDLARKELNDYRFLFNETPSIPRLSEWIGHRIALKNLYRWKSKNMLN
ncbi:NERD domain-containing protein [Aerococcaceae bacterium DSM 111176]|nr:NERD domain-containing protein [Aerococcaceae bacterium DSM 111176]